MGVRDFLLGLMGFPKIYRLRRRYDRVRERADKKLRNRVLRYQILSVLDAVEPHLETLEEQKLSRYERKRLIGYVEAGVAKAKSMIERSEEIRKNLYSKKPA
ncbi:MAG: hypothetical protein HY368_00575 [Candidatus Aenigmarchaeota archaeon]|nr:hypothetical protein [Candidatus Aenigmarchaeota archaeon]